MKKKIIIVLISIILLCGCGQVTNDEKIDPNEIITSSEINDIINENNYIILDVRTIEEYNEIHIKGSINIPYDQITNEVELDKDKTILVYCKSGKRASIATETLLNLGYKAYNMGGIESINLEKEN